tara:strand:+ start:629 stop:847 length:219 start_codon:yes stop_codon:yes gene_type:complete
MCFSSPKSPPPPPAPPPAPPPPPPPPKVAAVAKTKRQMSPTKKTRGAQAQLKRQGPTLGGITSGSTGVNLYS